MMEEEEALPIFPQAQEVQDAICEPLHAPKGETLLQQPETQRLQLEVELSRKLEVEFAKKLEAQLQQYKENLAKEFAVEKERCEKELQERLMSMLCAISKA